MRKWATVFCLASVLAMHGCGGGGSSSSAVAPAPSPTPTPTPTPNPSPTPAPAPGATFNLAGAVNGSALRIRRVCSSSRATYTGEAISGVASLGTVTVQAPETGRFLTGPDRIEAFGDTFLRVPTADSRQFSLFGSLSDFSMAVVNTLATLPPSATYGYTDRTTLCFYATGLAPPSNALQAGYDGRADGLFQTAAGARRLYGSVVDATVNSAAGTGTLTMELTAYASAFPDLAAQTPTPVGKVTANLIFADGQVTASGITAPAGFTGTIAGEIVGPDGLILVFEFRDAAGSVIWGAAALDNFVCRGCWDY